MAYRLDSRETLGDGIRRAVVEQLTKAEAGLRAASQGESDKAVHEARKATKKSRAALGLVRDEVGAKTSSHESTALRDAARRLSAPRDATILVDAVDRLGRQIPLASRSLAPLKAVLTERRDEVAKRVIHDESAMTGAAEALAEIRTRIARLEIGTDRFSALEGGLKSTYSRGRDAFADARKKPTDKRMHEWRKRVKDLWYHMRLLQAVWPGPMGELVNATDTLGDLLGEDHDLAVLAETVRDLVAEGLDAGAGETVLTLAANRRSELHEEIWPLGTRVYADKPKCFVRRTRVLYRAWRAETVWHVSAEVAAAVRDLLEARRIAGNGAAQHPLRERLRHHGLSVSDVEARLPDRDGDLGAADFDALVESGRVKIVEPG